MTTLQTILEPLLDECAMAVFDQEQLGLRATEEPYAFEHMTVVGFSNAKVRGALSIGMTNTILEQATERGLDGEDWLCEIGNRVLGRIKNRLLSYGVEVYMAVPIGVRGVRVEPTGTGGLIGCRQYTSARGAACAWLSARTAPGFVVSPIGDATVEIPNEGELVLF